MFTGDIWIILLSILSPTLLAALICFLKAKTPLGRRSVRHQQIVTGILMGLLVLFYYVAQIKSDSNIWILLSDAIVLLSGALYGTASALVTGIFAAAGYLITLLPYELGLTGSTSWFYYNQIPGAVMIPVCVLFSILVYHFLSEDLGFKWYTAIVIGLILLTVHTFFDIVCNYRSAWSLFYSLTQYDIWNMLYNSLAVIAAGIFCSVRLQVTGEGKKQKAETRLSYYFFRVLVIGASVAFASALLFCWQLEWSICKTDLIDRFDYTIYDIRCDLYDREDSTILAQTIQVADYLDGYGDLYSDTVIKDAMKDFAVDEINIIDENGIITMSTNPDFIGFDMASGEQSSAFLVLLKDNDLEYYSQEFGPISHNSSVKMKYAACRLKGGGFVQIGYNEDTYHAIMDSQLENLTKFRHFGITGGIMIVSEQGVIVSDPSYSAGTSFSDLGMHFSSALYEPKTLFRMNINDIDYYCYYEKLEGYYVICYVITIEGTYYGFVSFFMILMALMLLSFILIAIVYRILDRHVVKDINKVRESLDRISSGDLDVSLDVRSSDEFNTLSDDINLTVTTLKGYIDEAKKRMEKDLETARRIQLSALPQIQPRRPEFSIYGKTRPAKEVGGDLYDYMMLDNHRLMFLIGDVSGKGIPAALFMMQAKTKMADTVKTGMPLEKVAEEVNDYLCENNETNTFVTVWLGILDLKTGKGHYVNAGHNPPLIGNGQKGFSYLIPARRNLVFGAMDGLSFRCYDFRLEPGDRIILYTDGVTEAEDIEHNQYGETRLQAYADQSSDRELHEFSEGLYDDIDIFADKADQFDDITMLILDYTGPANGS